MKKSLILVILLLILALSACQDNKTIDLKVEENYYIIGVGETITFNPLVTNYNGGYELKLSDGNLATVKKLSLTATNEGQLMVILSLSDYPEIKTYIIINIIDNDLPLAINYYLNGGAISVEAITQYRLSELPLVLTIPEKEGATFLGWYLNSNFSGNALSSLTKDLSGEIKLYAKWSN